MTAPGLHNQVKEPDSSNNPTLETDYQYDTLDNLTRVDQWGYDAAGEVQSDGTNFYEYDAEGRQTGTLSTLTGLTGYVYDAEGRRAMKVVVNGFGGPNPSTTVQNEYLLGLDDEQITVLDGNNNWQWTNVYASGRVMATYDPSGTQFTLGDWLGTTRVQVDVTAPSTVSIAEQCSSLPYGDGLSCTGSDANQLHFTGKERDQESTNDYFLARYYASNTAGRFLTPDWSAKAEPVPYAKLDNPQSLNLYAYADNNPITGFDVDGHLPTGQACGAYGVNITFSGETPKVVPCSSPAGAQDPPAQSTGWSLSWQVNASANFLGQELKGVADTTVLPVVNALEHPVDTAEGIANAVEHPIDTANAMINGAVDTAKAAASGDPRAIGQVAGSILSAAAGVKGAQAASEEAQGLRVVANQVRSGPRAGELQHLGIVNNRGNIIHIGRDGTDWHIGLGRGGGSSGAGAAVHIPLPSWLTN